MAPLRSSCFVEFTSLQELKQRIGPLVKLDRLLFQEKMFSTRWFLTSFRGGMIGLVRRL